MPGHENYFYMVRDAGIDKNEYWVNKKESSFDMKDAKRFHSESQANAVRRSSGSHGWWVRSSYVACEKCDIYGNCSRIDAMPKPFQL